MGLRYRFCLQLDSTEESDPEFNSIYDVNMTEVHSRPTGDIVDSPHQEGCEKMSAIFREAEELIMKRLEEAGLSYIPQTDAEPN